MEIMKIISSTRQTRCNTLYNVQRDCISPEVGCKVYGVRWGWLYDVRWGWLYGEGIMDYARISGKGCTLKSGSKGKEE